MSNNTAIILEANGEIFGGWTSVSYTHSLDSLSREFELEINDETGGFESGIKEETEVALYAVEDLGVLKNETEQLVSIIEKTKLFDAIVMDTNTSIGPDGYGFNVSGNDRTIDLVECSAIVPSNTWRRAKVSKIITDLCRPYSIDVDASGLSEDRNIKKFSINSGDTAFTPIERLCRYAGVIPFAQLDGNIKLISSDNLTEVSEVPLVVGKNVIRINRGSSVRNRRSEIIGKSIVSGNGKRWSNKNLKIKAVAFDTEITRYRPMLFIAESKAEKRELQNRVNWEAQVRKGRAGDITVQLSDIFKRDNNGEIVGIWQVGERVPLVVDKWNLNRQYLIASFNFSMSNSGRRVSLTLRDPDTYKPEPGAEI